MKEFWQTVNKIYFANCSLAFVLVLTIILTFVVQFKVEALQDEIAKTESEIATYQDEIQLLEVEWTYLTRPSRLRALSAQYLQDNTYAVASQIKEVNQLEKYYLVSYQKSVDSQEDGSVKDVVSSDLQQVSF